MALKCNKIKYKLKKWVKLILNWRFLVCFGIAWTITNGWSYVFIVLGSLLNIAWMFWLGTTYLAFLWLPFTVEKIVTFAIAIFLVKKLFKKHNKELEEQLNDVLNNKNKEENKSK
jgi:hypothetical protein